MPVPVPRHYVPLANVDYDGEVRSLLGCGLFIDDFEIKPPTLGTFTLFELVDNDFFINPTKCNVSEMFIAVYIVNHGTKCKHLCNKRQKYQLLEKSMSYIGNNADALIKNSLAIYKFIGADPFLGFDMMPRNGGKNNKAFIFDAEYLASVLSYVCMTSNNTPEYVLWQMPMTMAGHIYAARSKYEGVKNIGRKDDSQILDRIMKESLARELRGELHPWQINDPLNPLYQLSKEQVNARPEIIEEFEALKVEAFKKLGAK